MRVARPIDAATAWVPSYAMTERYDLCVIGGGTAGVAAAREGLRLGARVVLASDEGLRGGTCIRRGCMPAKTLLSATERLDTVAAAGDVGVSVARPSVDLAAVVARKRELVEYFTDARVPEFAGIPVIDGRAAFADARTLVARGERIDAERFVIATGSTHDAPPWPGFTPDAYVTSDDALAMTEVPPSLAVVGGGPVGCEFAQYFARLGTRVTLLQDGEELLRNEDRDVGAAVREALAAGGVTVVCDAYVRRADAAGDERIVTYEHGGRAHELRVALVLVATGRRPNTRGLDLDRAGIARTATGAIAVDARLRSTTHPSAYAAGDVLGRRYLVHVAEYAGRLAASNALGTTTHDADFDRYEAHAVYTQPQIAVAGLTERELHARGIAIRTRTHPFEDLGKTLVSGAYRGFVKMIVDSGERVRGVAVVSDDAIDLIGEAIALIDRGATATDVADMPHLHPTMSEIFARVAEDFAR